MAVQTVLNQSDYEGRMALAALNKKLRGDAQADGADTRAEIEHARDGYGHIAAALWSPAGELIAISRQTVTVFG